ncbi:MAG: D-aminoacyl-tRNA deacylase [Oligoflexia bacterium]
MKVVIQRVLRASVEVEGRKVASIERGLLTLLGVESADTFATAERMMERIAKLRIFPDSLGKMNSSLSEVRGEHLLVSQFTLLADLRKGNRPSFTGAGSPDHAVSVFEHAVKCSRSLGLKTQSGVFQADMKVELVNDGPVTFVLDLAGESPHREIALK